MSKFNEFDFASCKTCIYHDPDMAECHFHPPERNKDDKAVYPVVDDNRDWCGKYLKKDLTSK